MRALIRLILFSLFIQFCNNTVILGKNMCDFPTHYFQSKHFNYIVYQKIITDSIESETGRDRERYISSACLKSCCITLIFQSFTFCLCYTLIIFTILIQVQFVFVIVHNEKKFPQFGLFSAEYFVKAMQQEQNKGTIK